MKYFGDLYSKNFYATHLNTHITPLKIRGSLATLLLNLTRAHTFKDIFFEAFGSMNVREARGFYHIKSIKQNTPKFQNSNRLLLPSKRAKKDYLYFIKVVEKTGEVIRPYHGGAIIEEMNKKIKVIKRVSYL